MPRGFVRRRGGALLGALAIACLGAAAVPPSEDPRAAVPSHPRGPRRVLVPIEPAPAAGKAQPLRETSAAGKAWWEISLAVSVRGDYAVDGPPPPACGTYAFRARWTGRLELDSDQDLLLVHLGTEILDWSLRETCGPDGRQSVLEAAAGLRPALRMEYLIKDGADIEFVFGLGEIAVPLHRPGLGLALDLPRTSSRRPGPPGHGYGDFVQGGSCRVAVPQKDLDVQAPERRFSWEWSRDRELIRDGRPVRLTHRHSAEAVVSVIVH